MEECGFRTLPSTLAHYSLAPTRSSNELGVMSACGTKRTCRRRSLMSAFGAKADISEVLRQCPLKSCLTLHRTRHLFIRQQTSAITFTSLVLQHDRTQLLIARGWRATHCSVRSRAGEFGTE